MTEDALVVLTPADIESARADVLRTVGLTCDQLAERVRERTETPRERLAWIALQAIRESPVSDEVEPLYDLDTLTWSRFCSCVAAMQVDPECPYHGRLRGHEEGES